jgi:ATP-dependent helicase HepA
MNGSMAGFLVKHAAFGVGKIVSMDAAPNGNMRIAFLGHQGGPITIESRTLGRQVQRTHLPPGSRCKTDRGACSLIRLSRPFEKGNAALYEVQYDDGGEFEIVEESAIAPLKVAPVREPELKLAALDHEGYPIFREREALAHVFHRMLKEGNGLRSLLSSRIDLHPHQAYVAGVILLDRQRRYILADEVGLGKTIEAGIVLRDLLVQRPDARVLILCPGTLTQQWLCELYTKFGDSSFRMLDLYSAGAGRVVDRADSALLRRTIVSTGLALDLAERLSTVKWDMVIVDEAHHLLGSPELYRLTQKLSEQPRSVLLLSAIPAQQREDEFRRLLALLEPDRYSNMTASHFRELYDVQRDVGRKMRLVAKRLGQFAAGELPFSGVFERANDFLTMPRLAQDAQVAVMLSGWESAARTDTVAELLERGKDLLHYLGDQYRINRRILRNRRQRLIEDGQLQLVTRRLSPHSYTPEQLEINATTALKELLAEMLRSAGNGINAPLVLALARLGFQSLAWPPATVRLLSTLRDAGVGPVAEISARDRETGAQATRLCRLPEAGGGTGCAPAKGIRR